MANFNPEDLRRAQDQLRQSVNQGSLRRNAQSRRSADKAQRAEAEKEYAIDENGRKLSRPMFLRPGDIAKGEEYDISRVLYTTLGQKNGDVPRRITRDDILAFQENITLLKDQYTKGITPQNIVNLSRQDDIDRVNEQITMAVPISRSAGLVHFLTNAGPDSKDINHNVEVEFTNFKSVVFNIKKEVASTVKNRLAYGNVRFECDCGKHTFWYRYMATIGGYGLGRAEGGFPKVRNPMLSGVACKHVLRVMQWVMSPAGIQYLKKQVDNDREKQLGARYKQSDKQINNQLDQQVKDIESGKTRQIVANIKQAEREMLRRADNVAAQMRRKEKAKRQTEIKRIEKELGKNAAYISERTQLMSDQNQMQQNLRSGIISQKVYNTYLAGHKAELVALGQKYGIGGGNAQ